MKQDRRVVLGDTQSNQYFHAQSVLAQKCLWLSSYDDGTGLLVSAGTNDRWAIYTVVPCPVNSSKPGRLTCNNLCLDTMHSHADSPGFLSIVSFESIGEPTFSIERFDDYTVFNIGAELLSKTQDKKLIWDAFVPLFESIPQSTQPVAFKQEWFDKSHELASQFEELSANNATAPFTHLEFLYDYLTGCMVADLNSWRDTDKYNLGKMQKTVMFLYLLFKEELKQQIQGVIRGDALASIGRTELRPEDLPNCVSPIHLKQICDHWTPKPTPLLSDIDPNWKQHRPQFPLMPQN